MSKNNQVNQVNQASNWANNQADSQKANPVSQTDKSGGQSTDREATESAAALASAVHRRRLNRGYLFSIPWYNLASIRIMFALLIMAVLFGGFIYYYIAFGTKPKLLADAQKLIERQGNNAVSNLLARVSAIESTAKSQAAIAAVIEDTPKTYIKELSKNLVVQRNPDILSGGYWTMPSREIGNELNHVFWARNPLGMMEYQDDYHSIDFRRQEWFNLAYYTPRNHCAWSHLYTDAITQKQMITCSVAVKRSKQDFLGVATVDMDLSRLDEFSQDLAEAAGGYVFIVDKDNVFISVASKVDLKETLGQNLSAQLYLSAKNYARMHPDFLPVSNSMDRLDQEILRSAEYQLDNQFPVFVSNLKKSTPLLSQTQAQLGIASLNNVLKNKLNAETSLLFEKLHLPHDNLLGGAAVVNVFHMPATFWKLGIVIPEQQITAHSQQLLTQLLTALLTALVVLILLGYYFIGHGILRPIRKTSEDVAKIGNLLQKGDLDALQQRKLPIQRSDEVGLVRQSVNVLSKHIVASEQNLMAVNRLLEKKVEQRTNELNQVLHHLQNSQTQLVHTEKMSLLGQMVAGLAHEVNTPLAYIKNNIVMTSDFLTLYEALQTACQELNHHINPVGDEANRVSKDSPEYLAYLEHCLANILEKSQKINDRRVQEYTLSLLDDSLSGVEQISALIVNLRIFSPEHESKIKTVNIHECLDRALAMSRTHRKDFKVVRQYAADIPDICAASSQLIQVFINLFNNAIYALEDAESPRLVVTTYCFLNDINIEIKDNGSGIDEQTIQNIFKPFYTTKPAGKGTGLGLAICQQIITTYGGSINLYSSPGQGTQFTIVLPIAEDEGEE